MRYTVIFDLTGSLAEVAAVEWTEAADPAEADWLPCRRRADGRWRLASRAVGQPKHLRDPGLFANIGLRYRLSADGPWSPVSAGRKEITIVAVTPEQWLAPPAAGPQDWSALAPLDLANGLTVVFVLAGTPAAAVAVAWTEAAAPGEGDWRLCVALGEAHWRLGAPLDHDPTGVAIRYRLAADGAWSPASLNRRSLDLAALPPLPIAPLLLAPPALAGAGKIGQPVSLDAGLWGGVPTPEVARQWCRDGVPIPGATAASYTPGLADDLTGLTCRVTAANSAGTGTVETAVLKITHVAPVATGELFDEVFDADTGDQEVPTASAFTGANLRFAVSGAGASVDDLGVVSIPTGTLLSGETVVVTASNSGGAAMLDFLVTVEPPLVAPEPLTAAQWTLEATLVAAPGHAGKKTAVLALGAASGVSELFWVAQAAQADPFPTVALGGGRFRLDSATGAHALAPGQAVTIRLRYKVAGNPLLSGNSIARTAKFETWHNLPLRKREEFEAGLVGGESEQMGRGQIRSMVDGNLVVYSHDVGGPGWISEDAGLTWRPMRRAGAWGKNSQWTACDIGDPAVMFSYCHDNITSAYWGEIFGIFRSLDRGATWTRVLHIPNGWVRNGTASNTDINSERTMASLFAQDPQTAALPLGQRKCYVAVSKFADNTGGGAIFHSPDGGDTWTGKATLDHATFGWLGALICHPTQAGRLYLGTENGLFRSDDHGGTFAKVTALTATGPVRYLHVTGPAGGAADVVRLSVEGKGVFKLTGTGAAVASYTQTVLLSDPDVTVAAFSPADPACIWAIRNGSNTQRPVFSANDGKSWTACTVKPRPAHTTWQMNIGTKNRRLDWILPHPTMKLEASAIGQTSFWRTTDGTDWVNSSTGYTGGKAQGFFFDPLDERTFGMVMADRGVEMTTNGGDWFENRNVPTSWKDGTDGVPTKLVTRTAECIDFKPGSTTEAIMVIGQTFNETATAMTIDAGLTWTWKNPGFTKYQVWCGWHRQKPNIVLTERQRSTDGGETWSDLGKRVLGFRDPADNDKLWGFSAAEGADTLFMSDDAGATWQPYLPLTWPMTGQDNFRIFAPHPTAPDQFATIGADKEFRLWTGSAWLLPAGGNGPKKLAGGAKNYVGGITFDPTHPNIVYARTAENGRPVFWRSLDSGLTWADITHNAAFASGGMTVHPLTGDVFVGRFQGTIVLPPPGDFAYARPSLVASKELPILH